VGNVSKNVYAKFRCALLRIKKALGIFRDLITITLKTRTTKVAFGSLPGPKIIAGLTVGIEAKNVHGLNTIETNGLNTTETKTMVSIP